MASPSKNDHISVAGAYISRLRGNHFQSVTESTCIPPLSLFVSLVCQLANCCSKKWVEEILISSCVSSQAQLEVKYEHWVDWGGRTTRGLIIYDADDTICWQQTVERCGSRLTQRYLWYFVLEGKVVRDFITEVPRHNEKMEIRGKLWLMVGMYALLNRRSRTIFETSSWTAN